MLKDVEGRQTTQKSTESLENCSKSNLWNDILPQWNKAPAQGNTAELLLTLEHTSVNKKHMKSYMGILGKEK